MKSQKSLNLVRKIQMMTTKNQEMAAHKMETKKITQMEVTATVTKHQKMMSNQRSQRPLNAHTNLDGSPSWSMKSLATYALANA